MRFYVGKSLGGGVHIGTSISSGGGGGRKDHAAGCISILSVFFGMILAIFVGGCVIWLFDSIGFAILLGLAIMVASVCYGVWVDIKIALEAEKEKERDEVFEKIMKCMSMISEGKAVETRQNNCTKAIGLLGEIQQMDLASDQHLAAHELSKVLTSTRAVLPIAENLEKAERAEFKGQEKKALRYYLDILHRVKSGKVTDEDFAVGELTDGDTGEVITTKYLVRKAKSLGWDKK
jgi:hypothetical protein